MSVSGISTSSLYNYNSAQSSLHQIQQTFQQLGQDLQSGNLSAAQSDFAALLKLAPQLSSTSSSQNNSPIAQAFQQLAKDLQSGNLSAAQQDFSTIQQDVQNQAAQSQTSATQTQSHHHHHGGSGSSEISQLLSQLGTALQSGNLASAQQAFSTLQQQFQQSAPASGSTTEPSQSNSNSVSITA